MNNDLEQFSEESLKDMQKHVAAGMALGYADALLIRRVIDIALAAKQAKMAFIPEERPDSEGLLADGWNACRAHMLYTPQPAHTEQDGCQWNTDEDSVYSTGCGNEWQFTEGGLEDNKIKFCPYCSGKIATPKPESE